MEVSKFNNHFYNQGYSKAIRDLEGLVVCIADDCKRLKVKFNAERIHEFFKLVLENQMTIREGNFGIRSDAFVRVNAISKKLEFYKPKI